MTPLLPSDIHVGMKYRYWAGCGKPGLLRTVRGRLLIADYRRAGIRTPEKYLAEETAEQHAAYMGVLRTWAKEGKMVR